MYLADSGSILLFVIASFSLAAILILKKDTLPPGMKRPLALIALVMVSSAFVLIIYSLLNYR